MKWDKPPGDFIKQITDELDKQYRTFAIDCYNNVVELSPVDTGTYRRSHHVSIGAPSMAQTGAGRGAIMGIAKGNYPTIFIQTNSPYSIRLENGWSKQAPTGVYQNAYNNAMARIG
ncbi:HK97 gp10 family phage protein [Moraxella sp. ZY200743]|uniref:HK97 gp10 family phage protein n=1 Tax=Moraxella sp. ZY200743 TaxID=2911970 RepID=UPI003D7C514C